MNLILDGLSQPLPEDLVLYTWKPLTAARDLITEGFGANSRSSDHYFGSEGRGLFAAEHPFSSISHYPDDSLGAVVEIVVPKGTRFIDGIAHGEDYYRDYRIGPGRLTSASGNFAVRYAGNSLDRPYWVFHSPMNLRAQEFRGMAFSPSALKSMAERGPLTFDDRARDTFRLQAQRALTARGESSSMYIERINPNTEAGLASFHAEIDGCAAKFAGLKRAAP